MPNTSETGGYLLGALPDNIVLRRFIGGVIGAVTGLVGDLVRPRWQPNPPATPNQDVDWCAFGITQSTPDASAFVGLDDTGEVGKFIRHEEVEILASFYGPNASGYSEVLRDGLELSQNREAMFLNGMGLKGCGPSAHVPEIVNQLWVDRVDLPFTIRREIRRDYSLLSFLQANAAGSFIRTETLQVPLSPTPP